MVFHLPNKRPVDLQIDFEDIHSICNKDLTIYDALVQPAFGKKIFFPCFANNLVVQLPKFCREQAAHTDAMGSLGKGSPFQLGLVTF